MSNLKNWCRFAAAAVILAALPSEASEFPNFHRVCGMVASLNSPADVHTKSQLLGVSLDSVTDYNPELGQHGPWSLGILTNDENALGLTAIVSAALVAKKNVTVWYRTHDRGIESRKDTIACVQIQRAECPAPKPIQTPEANTCIGKP